MKSCIRAVVFRACLLRPLLSLAVVTTILIAVSAPLPSGELHFVPQASADSVYFNLTTGNLNFAVTAATANQITANDIWTGVPSVQGYKGTGLTATHGVDPQTVLTAEFTNSLIPNNPTQVHANKGNPSAFNTGGLAEFDSGTYLAIGFQGNVQSNPYLVFYLNTTGRTNITMSYQIQDIDGGSNNSVSQIALQYRIGETGNFVNIPGGFIADATDPNVAGRITTKSVALPAAANNQPKVQVRLLTTDAANSSGSSTPDEWIGVNNVVISSIAPTAAGVDAGGRVVTAGGAGIGGASVLMYDSVGNIRTAITNPFGYYSFENVRVGESYVFEVRSKRVSFAWPMLSRVILDSVADIYFVADSPNFK